MKESTNVIFRPASEHLASHEAEWPYIDIYCLILAYSFATKMIWKMKVLKILPECNLDLFLDQWMSLVRSRIKTELPGQICAWRLARYVPDAGRDFEYNHGSRLMELLHYLIAEEQKYIAASNVKRGACLDAIYNSNW